MAPLCQTFTFTTFGTPVPNVYLYNFWHPCAEHLPLQLLAPLCQTFTFTTFGTPVPNVYLYNFWPPCAKSCKGKQTQQMSGQTLRVPRG